MIDSESTTQDYSVTSEQDLELVRVEGSLRSFGIRAANDNGRRSTASMLVNKMYSAKGYGSGFSVGAAPHQLTLVASDFRSGDPIGTLTVGIDRGDGLLVDAMYKEEADNFRAMGSRLGEMTKFAVERTTNSKHLLAALFHIAHIYAYHLHSITDLLIEVNPAHASFYRRLLHFEDHGVEKMNPRVRAPSVLLWLNLMRAQELITKYGGQGSRGESKSLYPYFFSKDEEAGVIARLRCIEIEGRSEASRPPDANCSGDSE